MSERENFSDINVSATHADGTIVPMISFGGAPSGKKLVPESYGIDGNDLLAYYDGDHKLIFVLDKTVSKHKPNVLLVMNKTDGKKWDDVLANDYGMDLETIRPKTDNKYQKLDIEYDGISIYSKLINDFNAGNDLTDALNALLDFRAATAQSVANARLDAALDVIAKSKSTIDASNDTLRELAARQKALREKLSKQKTAIGKEPTKQSASKILKTESLLDAAAVKKSRAEKRLANAKKRMAAAKTDADAAKNILTGRTRANAEIYEKNKDSEMAEDVKPLFEKDPNIVDEKIAFKPIEFEVSSESSSSHNDAVIPAKAETIDFKAPEQKVEEPIADPIIKPDFSGAPLSFTPPVATINPASHADLEHLPTPEVPRFEPAVAPVMNSAVMPALPNTPAATMDVVPANRPMSPISNEPSVAPINVTQHRPGKIYYLLLIVLIALSIFTLWIYQKQKQDIMPNLATVEETKPVADAEPAPVPLQAQPEPVPSENPFIDVTAVAPVAPAQPEPTPAPTPINHIIVQEEGFQAATTLPAPLPEQLVVQPEPEPVAPVVPAVEKDPYDISGPQTTEGPKCDDGSNPDTNGCCTGEVSVDQSDVGKGLVCCEDFEGGSCFDPLK